MGCSAIGEPSGVAEIAASIGSCADERRGGCTLPLPVSMAPEAHSACITGAVLALVLKYGSLAAAYELSALTFLSGGGRRNVRDVERWCAPAAPGPPREVDVDRVWDCMKRACRH